MSLFVWLFMHSCAIFFHISIPDLVIFNKTNNTFDGTFADIKVLPPSYPHNASIQFILDCLETKLWSATLRRQAWIYVPFHQHFNLLIFISNLTFVPWLVNTVPVHLTLTFALFVRKRGGTKQPKRYALQEWLC